MGQTISTCLDGNNDAPRTKRGAMVSFKDAAMMSESTLDYDDLVALNRLQGKYDMIEATPSFETQATEALSEHNDEYDCYDDDDSYYNFPSTSPINHQRAQGAYQKLYMVTSPTASSSSTMETEQLARFVEQFEAKRAELRTAPYQIVINKAPRNQSRRNQKRKSFHRRKQASSVKAKISFRNNKKSSKKTRKRKN